jgi:hypothetical protein
MKDTNYWKEAKDDAKDFVENFKDAIAEQIVESGKASDDYNNDYDGGDSYFHESYVDKDYSLQEAAELLDQLDRYEETDSGLWEGLEPRRAIAAQAAYTYGNAVSEAIQELIKDINTKVEYIEVPEGEDLTEEQIKQDIDEALAEFES